MTIHTGNPGKLSRGSRQYEIVLGKYDPMKKYYTRKDSKTTTTTYLMTSILHTLTKSYPYRGK